MITTGVADVPRRAERVGGVIRRVEALLGTSVRRSDAGGRDAAVAAARRAR